MDFRDTWSDWKAIDSPKRLRGACLHTARLYKRQGNVQAAVTWVNRAKSVPATMSKEAINICCYMASDELGLIVR